MELLFLGTGAGKPCWQRNVTGIVLNLLEEQHGLWLFDCGEGSQHQLLRARLSLSKIEKIFITHLHGDHIFGLPGLLTSRSMDGCTSPVTLYGPVGLQHYIDTVLNLSDSFLTFPLTIVEITHGWHYSDHAFTIHALELAHRITSYGYRIQQHDKLGALQIHQLLALGVKAGPWLQDIKKGETVTLPDGRIIDGNNYRSAPTPGKTVAIFGDTAPTPQALVLANQADYLVHETTLEASLADKAHNNGHSTTFDAATLAKQSGAKQLIITHLSSRYSKQDAQQLLTECQMIFPETKLATDLASFKL